MKSKWMTVVVSLALAAGLLGVLPAPRVLAACVNNATTQFRSLANGNWNSTSTWECSDDGSTWQVATVTPTSSYGAITVRSPHVVTVASAVSVDQVTVDASGQVTVNDVSWTILNGSGTDLIVNGTVKITGTGTNRPIVDTGTIQVNSGGIFEWARNTITGVADLPQATWDANSTFLVTGITNASGMDSSWKQNFGNYTWNCTGQSQNINLAATFAPSNVQGNLRIQSTGNPTIRDLIMTGVTSLTLAVGGDLIIEGGSFDYSNNTDGPYTLNLAGSYSQTAGTFKHTGSTSLSFNFTGTNRSFAQSGGTFTTTNINFTVNSGAALTLSNNLPVASSRNLTVNGTLNTGTSAVTGAGVFTLSSGATLGIGSPDGIASSGATGNVQTTTRNFNTGANYTYNGSLAQVTGNGLPATVNNLTIDNAAAVSLSAPTTVNGTLTLSNGLLTLGANNLTIASNNAIAGSPFSVSNMVVADGSGALCKQFTANGSYDYPIGDNTSGAEYSPVTSFSVSGTSYSNAAVCFRVTDAVHPSKPVAATTYITRYWTGTQSGTIDGLSYGATFNFVSGDVVQVGAETMSGKKWNNGPAWTELGAVSGTTFAGSGLNSFSAFTAFKSGVLAVTLAEFFAQQVNDHVLVTWETASELGNLGFNLYRGTSPAGPDRRLNDLLIPSQSLGNPGGFVYTWEDYADLVPGVTYYYWVEDVDVNGAATRHGPVSVDFVTPTAVTLSGLQASPVADMATLPWLWIVLAAGAALGASRMRR